MPSLPLQGCLPVSLQATLWWNLPKTPPMHGFITHVSDPYSITDWTTAKYIWTEVRASAPSLPRTFVSRAHFRLSFRRFLNTVGQLSSVAVRIRPMYLKEVNRSRGSPYYVNAFSAPNLAASFSRCCHFLSAPCR